MPLSPAELHPERYSPAQLASQARRRELASLVGGLNSYQPFGHTRGSMWDRLGIPRDQQGGINEMDQRVTDAIAQFRANPPPGYTPQGGGGGSAPAPPPGPGMPYPAPGGTPTTAPPLGLPGGTPAYGPRPGPAPAFSRPGSGRPSTQREDLFNPTKSKNRAFGATKPIGSMPAFTQGA